MNTNIKEIDVTLLLERIEKERINKLKACKKYYEKNKERLQEYRRNLYEEQKDDPEYKQRLKETRRIIFSLSLIGIERCLFHKNT